MELNEKKQLVAIVAAGLLANKELHSGDETSLVDKALKIARIISNVVRDAKDWN